MSLKKPNASFSSIVLAVAAPCVMFLYGIIRDALREPLECETGTVCVDTRSLSNISSMMVLWTVLGVGSVALALVAMQRKAKFAKTALAISIVLVIVPIVILVAGT